MKGNRLTYEQVTMSCGASILCRTDSMDHLSWEMTYYKGYRPPHFPLPTVQTIAVWCPTAIALAKLVRLERYGIGRYQIIKAWVKPDEA